MGAASPRQFRGGLTMDLATGMSGPMSECCSRVPLPGEPRRVQAARVYHDGAHARSEPDRDATATIGPCIMGVRCSYTKSRASTQVARRADAERRRLELHGVGISALQDQCSWSLPSRTMISPPTRTVASGKNSHRTTPPRTLPPSSVLSPRLMRTTPLPYP